MWRRLPGRSGWGERLRASVGRVRTAQPTLCDRGRPLRRVAAKTGVAQQSEWPQTGASGPPSLGPSQAGGSMRYDGWKMPRRCRPLLDPRHEDLPRSTRSRPHSNHASEPRGTMRLSPTGSARTSGWQSRSVRECALRMKNSIGTPTVRNFSQGTTRATPSPRSRAKADAARRTVCHSSPGLGMSTLLSVRSAANSPPAHAPPTPPSISRPPPPCLSVSHSRVRGPNSAETLFVAF